jgi:hypothetical protein
MSRRVDLVFDTPSARGSADAAALGEAVARTVLINLRGGSGPVKIYAVLPARWRPSVSCPDATGMVELD